MNTYKLINKKTKKVVDSAVNGFPPIRYRESLDGTKAPIGYKYVQFYKTNEHYDSETHKIVEKVTNDGVYEKVVKLTKKELKELSEDASVNNTDEVEQTIEISNISKLALKRKLGVKWILFKKALETLPEDVREDWELATSISLDDPIVEEYGDTVRRKMKLTKNEFNDLFKP